MRKLSLLCALLLTAFVGCENLDEYLTDDLTTTFTFYDNDDDTTELAACSYRIGTVLSVDSLPVKSPKEGHEGYLVGGWRFYQKETGIPYDSPANVTVGDDGTVTSVTVTSVPLSFQVVWWKPIEYTIIFDGNGGATDDEKTHYEQLFKYDEDIGKPLRANEFTRNGYDFNGWNVAVHRNETKADYEDEFALENNFASEDGAEVTLYACWLKTSILISFDAGDGSGTMEAAELQVGDSLPACTYTAPEGKHFAGWHWDGGSDEPLADAATLSEHNYPNKDVTLVAQWDWLPVTVTFDPNGGDGDPQTKTFKWGQGQPLAENNFTRHGYDFAGWKDSNGTAYTDGEPYSFKEAATLYAQWQAQTVSITFAADGGAGPMAAQELSFNDLPQPLAKNTFARTGWNFGGWQTAAGQRFADEASITPSAWDTLYAGGGAITLTAVWNPRCVVSSSQGFEDTDMTATADGLAFTAPPGSTYQWMLRASDGTVTPLGNEPTYTISYADYEHDTAEYTLVVTVFNASGIHSCWAKFRVNPQQ